MNNSKELKKLLRYIAMYREDLSKIFTDIVGGKKLIYVELVNCVRKYTGAGYSYGIT